jgi:hypothetical protein
LRLIKSRYAPIRGKPRTADETMILMDGEDKKEGKKKENWILSPI